MDFPLLSPVIIEPGGLGRRPRLERSTTLAQMSGKREKIVRDFFAAWAEPKPDERITQWREAYDVKSALDQIQAAVRPA